GQFDMHRIREGLQNAVHDRWFDRKSSKVNPIEEAEVASVAFQHGGRASAPAHSSSPGAQRACRAREFYSGHGLTVSNQGDPCTTTAAAIGYFRAGHKPLQSLVDKGARPQYVRASRGGMR